MTRKGVGGLDEERREGGAREREREREREKEKEEENGERS